MLELVGIEKDYQVGGEMVPALKGIDLQFRSSEFVSILGPSGCGKTTMLNIIGGLDQCTRGDLLINGMSTKDFKDRDWDGYRNHSIGFVFQTYNLIPHQSVLQNVELALTLSGVSKRERRERAKKALTDVGLGDQMRKKPSEMSGGQTQRVAIARALVNNPDIILADEPTGALDTKTSVQVLDILKEVASDRLVIMVTHNPDLAEKYSTRIIRMLDGKITEDSMPLSESEVQKEAAKDRDSQAASKGKKKKLPSMSLATSFGLSTKNLFTKKGRTALTSFAGSIGIIGIALVSAISQGVSNFIRDVQEETLSTYPLTIQQTNTDLTSVMETFMGISEESNEHSDNMVYQTSAVYEIVEALYGDGTTENDLKSFKTYLDEERADSASALADALSGIQYSYNLHMLVYTENVDGNIQISDTLELMQELLSENMNVSFASSTTGVMGSSMSMGGNLWEEMLTGLHGEMISPLIIDQYDVVYGAWPQSYDEVVLVLNENNELDDMTLYALGLESKEDVNNIVSAAINRTAPQERTEQQSWSYEEICDMDFRVVLNSDCYSYDEDTGLYNDLRDTDTGLNYLYDNALPLKVVGIIRPRESATASMLNGSIAYTKALTDYVVEQGHTSDVVQAQLDDPETDVLTGLRFPAGEGKMSDAQKTAEFKDYVADLNTAEKAGVYVQMAGIPSEEELSQMTEEALAGVTREEMETTLSEAFAQQMNMDADEVAAYLADMDEEDLTFYYTSAMQARITAQYAAEAQQSLSEMTPEQLVSAMDAELDALTDEQGAVYYDSLLEFSDSTYEENLTEVGYVDLDEPSSISLFASSFENKDVIEDVIADYNDGKDEMQQIQYTDYVGLMMSSVTTIINVITYVLIAFVAISLIVSSIMIGVITLISVQERTKEIGILRSLGASKRNVSNMFNAETVLIGATAGILGVVVVYLLCFPINALVQNLTGFTNLHAVLSPGVAITLVCISVLLTLISGLIPSRSAAKKDPVVALRTE